MDHIESLVSGLCELTKFSRSVRFVIIGNTTIFTSQLANSVLSRRTTTRHRSGSSPHLDQFVLAHHADKGVLTADLEPFLIDNLTIIKHDETKFVVATTILPTQLINTNGDLTRRQFLGRVVSVSESSQGNNLVDQIGLSADAQSINIEDTLLDRRTTLAIRLSEHVKSIIVLKARVTSLFILDSSHATD